MRFSIIDDGCSSCSLLKITLQLLGIAHTIVTPGEFKKNHQLTENTCFLSCQNGVKSTKLIQTHDKFQHIHLISDTKQPAELSARHLFIAQPFDIYQFKSKINEAKIAILHPDAELHQHESALEAITGNSDKINHVKDVIKQVANCDTNVLILGQSGTGKSVIAHCIHQLSYRNKYAFVPINCGAIPAELIESELFGHEKGAFTGAYHRRPGRFEIANKGTIFLDEIGDMPLNMQVKLLRAIQEKCIERVGSNETISIDTRIIAATNKNLEDQLQDGKFREDLYYRLNVIPIYLPSLKERPSDIPMLIDYHIQKISKRIKHFAEFSNDSIDLICQYSWPGNIRELANFLERMIVLYKDKIITPDDIINEYPKITEKKIEIKNNLAEVPDNFNIKSYLAEIEQQLIQAALQKSNGIISTAAQYLSVGRTTLIEKIKKYNLSFSD